MLLLFGASVYIAASMGLAGLLLTYLISQRPAFDIAGHLSWAVNNNFILVAIPLFVLMGDILLHSGVSDRMYRSLTPWFARLPGGLLHTNIAASAMFASVAGSSLATATTIGRVSIPFLRQQGYSDALLLGSLAAGGTLGILIPPSISFIIYGVLAEVSIGQLYMAGVVPGLLLAGTFMVIIALVAPKSASQAALAAGATWHQRLVGLVALIPILILIVIVHGLIYLGIATPTESAAFGVLGSLALAAWHRTLSLAMLRKVMLSTVKVTAMIFLILIGAVLLGFALTLAGVPAAISQWLIDLRLNPVTILLALIVLYLILGMFIESLTMMVTTVPVLVPVLNAIGVDLVLFGVVIVLMTEAALISPPVGMNIWVIQGIRGNNGPMRDVYLGALPFLVAIVIFTVVLVLVPQIALWLPGLVRG